MFILVLSTACWLNFCCFGVCGKTCLSLHSQTSLHVCSPQSWHSSDNRCLLQMLHEALLQDTGSFKQIPCNLIMRRGRLWTFFFQMTCVRQVQIHLATKNEVCKVHHADSTTLLISGEKKLMMLCSVGTFRYLRDSESWTQLTKPDTYNQAHNCGKFLTHFAQF